MTTQNLALIEQVMIRGDLSVLSPQQKVEYYANVCQSVGLNPLTKPLEYIKLNGREVLYATKGATEQLRNIHRISIKIVDKTKLDDVYVVTAEAIGGDGRCDTATGAVSVAGLKGEQLANAIMKAETKAKRRVTLSICGLNMLDESEVESIPSAKEIKSVNSVTISPVTVQAATNNVTIEKPAYEKFLEEQDALVAKKSAGVISFGKFSGKTFDEVGVDELGNYVRYLEISAADKGESLKGKAAQFAKEVNEYILTKRLGNATS